MASPMSPSKRPVTIAVLAAALRAGVYAAVAFVRTTWKARRNRRAVAGLLQFDDHALADIGLTRGDVAAVLSGPVFEDPSSRLRILAVERRAAKRAQVREWWEAGRESRAVRPHTAPLAVPAPVRAAI